MFFSHSSESRSRLCYWKTVYTVCATRIPPQILPHSNDRDIPIQFDYFFPIPFFRYIFIYFLRFDENNKSKFFISIIILFAISSCALSLSTPPPPRITYTYMPIRSPFPNSNHDLTHSLHLTGYSPSSSPASNILNFGAHFFSLYLPFFSVHIARWLSIWRHTYLSRL